SRASSRRITSGYVAALLATHKPVVDDEPIATIRSVAAALRRAVVRGKEAPRERLSLAARQTSASEGLVGVCAAAAPMDPAASPATQRARHAPRKPGTDRCWRCLMPCWPW